MTPEELLAQHNGDPAHARYVDLALAIFDGSAELHEERPKARRLLETGALLHNVALTQDERKHHTLGRDIVLGATLDDTGDDDRAIIACLVAFHRKKVRAEAEPAFVRLDNDDRERAMKLAAILRVADGLDYSQTQTTRIVRVGAARRHLQLQLSGPHAASDAARAEAKADLWRKVFDGELLFEVADAPEGAPLSAAEPLAPSPPADEQESAEIPEDARRLRADDTLVDATRKVLRRHFGKLLSYEAKVRAGDDPEDVHQMRVATRRLRAALQVLGPLVAPKIARAFRRQLRDVAAALGDVRDRDVFLGHVREYAGARDEAQREELSALTNALEREQRSASKRLLKRIDGRRYARFKRECARFLTASDEHDAPGEGPTPRVRYAAGSAILAHYEQLRAYEQLVPAHGAKIEPSQMAQVHQMRIAGKHFRYTLEIFADALGPAADAALEPLIALQEHLGALQDTEVALAYLDTLGPEHPTAVDQYAEARRDATTQLLAELPGRWERVAGEEYRRQLADLLVQL
jgi:CHAD domain-containing protein